MKAYLQMSSAAVVMGALRVKFIVNTPFLSGALDDHYCKHFFDAQADKLHITAYLVVNKCKINFSSATVNCVTKINFMIISVTSPDKNGGHR